MREEAGCTQVEVCSDKVAVVVLEGKKGELKEEQREQRMPLQGRQRVQGECMVELASDRKKQEQGQKLEEQRLVVVVA